MTDWPSMALMTDRWAVETQLDKIVSALSKTPDRTLIETVCKAAFADGAMRMLEEIDKRMKQLHEAIPDA